MDDKKYSILKWSYYESLLINNLGVKPTKIEDYELSNNGKSIESKWYDIEDWESLDDLTILGYLEELKPFRGELLVVTEASYFNDKLGPFQVNAVDMKQFVNSHLESFGECFFNGDVIIVSINDKLVWIFHHEGMYTLINHDNK